MAERILIENAINEKLTGETQANALDLIAFMRANEFLNEDGWEIYYKGEGIGCIDIAKIDSDKDEFWFWPSLGWDIDGNGSAYDELKEFAWAHVRICRQKKYCAGYCDASRNRWKIFGKEYESTCHAPMSFTNPNANTVENIKKLMLIIKQNKVDV